MKVEFLESFGGYAAGNIVELSESRGRWMVANGIARRVKNGEGDASTTEKREGPVDDEEPEQDEHDDASEGSDDDSTEDEDEEGEVVTDSDAEPEMARPEVTAGVQEWAAYARSRGATREDLKGLTKRKLIELYGND